MTDEQIIEALRYCNGVDYENYKALDFCGYQHPGRLARCAYVVIRRKQSKIEREIKEIKSEAVKEFAERLKKELQWDCEFSNKLVFENDIDNLVKEMTKGE